MGDWNNHLEGQDELAHTLYCIADVYNSVSEFDGAQRIYEESLRLGIESDENRSERKNLIHSAKCLIGIAKIHYKNDEYFESFKLFERALSYCEKHGKSISHYPQLLFFDVMAPHIRKYHKPNILLHSWLFNSVFQECIQLIHLLNQ